MQTFSTSNYTNLKILTAFYWTSKPYPSIRDLPQRTMEAATLYVSKLAKQFTLQPISTKKLKMNQK